jgi:hypothetical protein
MKKKQQRAGILVLLGFLMLVVGTEVCGTTAYIFNFIGGFMIGWNIVTLLLG